MPRILLAEMKQETATFNPARTEYESFVIHRGAEMITALEQTDTELAGALEVFRQHSDFVPVPALSARAVSGGPIRTAGLNRLLEELTEAVRQGGPVDAVCLILHGAMAGEEEMDPEGEALRRIRGIVGDVPLVATLDLHAILTDRMVELADILVPYHTYPHTDHYTTGQRAARRLLQLLAGDVTPEVARIRLPMLVRGDELLTATGLFGQAIRMCQALEAETDGLAAGVLIGNPFTDVPDLRSNVLITTNRNRDLAERTAKQIAAFMWDNRTRFVAPLQSIEDAIHTARTAAGLTVFSDAADATASGAAGDSNAILKALLDPPFEFPALVPIVDAPAASAVHQAGEGSTVTVQLGGTRDPGRFTPVEVTAQVVSLFDGNFRYEDGTEAHGGPTAVLRAGQVDILVTSNPVYVVGRQIFTAHGLDPRDYRVVVVKSPNGVRTHYESIAAAIVPVDAPGSTSANLLSLPFARCARPAFPLDADVPTPTKLQP